MNGSKLSELFIIFIGWILRVTIGVSAPATDIATHMALRNGTIFKRSDIFSSSAMMRGKGRNIFANV